MKKKFISLMLVAVVSLALVSEAGAASASERLLELSESGYDGSAPLSGLELPESFKLELSALDDCLVLDADAQIIVPDGEALPLASVQRRSFTQQDADRLMEYFLHGGTLYRNLGMTKPEVQARLERYRAMQRGEIPLELDGDRTIEDLPEVIARWEDYLAEAPDEDDREPAQTEFSSDDYGIEKIEGFGESEQGRVNFFIRNFPDYSNEAIVYLEGYGDLSNCFASIAGNGEEGFEPEISEAEALARGDGLMAALELEDMSCAKISPVIFSDFVELTEGSAEAQAEVFDSGYCLEYTRTLGETLLSLSPVPGSAIEDGDSGIWPYEQMSICVSGKGIVYMRWSDPCEVPVIENESAMLLPFGDIADIFEKMIVVTNNDIPAINQTNGFDVVHSFDIDRVSLGLMRVREKGNCSEGLIVPVWDFWGTRRFHTPEEEYSRYVYDGEYYEIALTINAIDGSIIDRSTGY